MGLEKYPQFVQEKIKTLSDRFGFVVKDLTEEIDEIYMESDPILVNFPGADTEEKKIDIKWRYAVNILWTRNAFRPPSKELEFIYLGTGGMRTKKGNPKAVYSYLYVMVRYSDGYALGRIMMKGEQADIYRNMNLWSLYKWKLGAFKPEKGEKESRNFIVDQSSKIDLENYKPLSFDWKDFRSRLGIKMIRVTTALRNLSKKQPKPNDKYVDDLDWKCVRGVPQFEPSYFTRKDKTKGMVIRINEDPLAGEIEVSKDGKMVDEKGNPIESMSIWLTPELWAYDKESICDFYGTVTSSEDRETGTKQASMNCCMVVPYMAKPMKDERPDDMQLEEEEASSRQEGSPGYFR